MSRNEIILIFTIKIDFVWQGRDFGIILQLPENKRDKK
jgi:hypothetical protein